MSRCCECLERRFLLSAGTSDKAGAVPRYDHIVVVMEENSSYSQILGPSVSPPTAFNRALWTDLLRVPIKKPADGELTVDQQAYNAVHGALRCLGERANSLLKTSFKALRRWRGCPWRIGDIAAAALVLLHHEHHRTT